MSLDDKQQLAAQAINGLEGWQLELAQAADVYWTTWRTGADWLWARGCRPWYAPEAACPEHFAPQRVDKDLDVLWLGRGYGPRHDLVRRLRALGFTVAAHGPGWEGGPVPFQELVRLYSRARVVLGMGGIGHTDEVKHLKGRDFEVPMSGAAYLTSFNPELTDHFDVGREILCYASPSECADVLAWALHRPALLAEIGAAGRARCLRDHTWDRRVADLLHLMGRSP
jgi:spore maturation protein CgeB